MHAVKREAYLTDHYIRAYRLAAIYCCVAVKSGRTLLGHCRNFKARRQALSIEHGRIELYGLWWVADDGAARRLLAALPPNCPAALARTALPKAASELRMSIMLDDEVRERAIANIEVLQKQQAPMLRLLNAEYRARRIERTAAGLKTPPYNAFIAHNLAKMIYNDTHVRWRNRS